MIDLMPTIEFFTYGFASGTFVCGAYLVIESWFDKRAARKRDAARKPQYLPNYPR